MKAFEFVKKYGWSRVKHCNKPSSRDNFFIVGSNVIRDQDLIELKRLVASYELVEKHGGLSKAKDMKIGEFPLGWVMNTSRLEQAIADMEACK